MKMIVFAAAGLLVCLGVAVSAAQAQETCSLKTLAGTYAFQETGSSSFVDLTTTPPPTLPPFHWNAAIAPFVTVGEVTFSPDGNVTGFYWIRNGSLNGGPNRVEMENATATMDSNCTGTITYDVVLTGIPTVTIEERIILFDQGREYRSIPISINGGDPLLVWVGVGHRIAKAGEPVNFCGPQTAIGTYLTTFEDITSINATTAFAARALFVFRGGAPVTDDYAGTFYGKLGPVPLTGDLTGTVTVNPDCSFTTVTTAEGVGTGSGVGVFFNQGKEFYSIVTTFVPSNPDVSLKFSLSYGIRIKQ